MTRKSWKVARKLGAKNKISAKIRNLLSKSFHMTGRMKKFSFEHNYKIKLLGDIDFCFLFIKIVLKGVRHFIWKPLKRR